MDANRDLFYQEYETEIRSENIDGKMQTILLIGDYLKWMLKSIHNH